MLQASSSASTHSSAVSWAVPLAIPPTVPEAETYFSSSCLELAVVLLQCLGFATVRPVPQQWK